MTHWFDVLYRRTPPQPDPAEITEKPADAEKEAKDQQPLFAFQSHALIKPPPLQGIPSRWSLEIQKIVFHLRPVVDDAEAPHHIVFSGIQRGSGNTTICYLVAHHVATERFDQKVLYIDLNPSVSAPPLTSADHAFKIGDVINANDFGEINRTLTSVSIRPSGEHSVSITSGWLYDFIALARQEFDWILVDAPPFFATPETYSVAKACDGVVLVLKSGETRYPALKALASDLDSLGIPIIGTVLNFRQYPIPKWLLRYV